MKTTWRDGDRLRSVELSPQGGGRFRVSVDGVERDLRAESLEDGRLRLTGPGGDVVAEVTAAGSRWFVRLGSEEYVLDREARVSSRAAATAGLEAPMNGVVTRVLVEPDDEVKRGQPLVALEAMKMEHVIRAPRDGRVRAVHAAPGAMVQGGTALLELHPETAA